MSKIKLLFIYNNKKYYYAITYSKSVYYYVSELSGKKMTRIVARDIVQIIEKLKIGIEE